MLEGTLNAFRRQQREDDDDRREVKPPVLSQGTQAVLQHDEQDGAPKRAEELVNAAEGCHQHRVAGVLPVEVVGVNALEQQRHQPAGDADGAAGDGEGRELGQIGVVAEAGDTLLVVTHRLHQPAERRVGHPPQAPENAQHDGEGEDVKPQR